MAQVSEFQRVSYTGTIVGVVMALSAVCKYLLSDNFATLLDFWTNKLDWHGWTYIVTTTLQLLSLIIINGPIRREFSESDICFRAYKKLRDCCSKEKDSEEVPEEDQRVIFANSSGNAKRWNDESYASEAKSR